MEDASGQGQLQNTECVVDLSNNELVFGLAHSIYIALGSIF